LRDLLGAELVKTAQTRSKSDFRDHLQAAIGGKGPCGMFADEVKELKRLQLVQLKLRLMKGLVVAGACVGGILLLACILAVLSLFTDRPKHFARIIADLSGGSCQAITDGQAENKNAAADAAGTDKEKGAGVSSGTITFTGSASVTCTAVSIGQAKQ
jgi:hypothetical protein